MSRSCLACLGCVAGMLRCASAVQSASPLSLHAGVRQARRVTAPKGFEPEEKDEAECAICHLYLHVSGLECNCCPGRRVCLQHADNLCECAAASWRLAFRYSLADLQAVLAEVASHIPDEGEGGQSGLLWSSA